MPAATQLGGAEMMLVHLLRANRCGPRVDYALAFLEDGPLVQDVRDLGYSCRVIPAGRLREPTHFLKASRALGRWMADIRPDGVLSWMGKAHLYAAPAARVMGLPAAWCQHAVPDAHWMNRLCTLMPARAILCSSRSVAGAQACLPPLRDTRVVFPAVDLDRFSPDAAPSPEEARNRLGLPVEPPIIGVLARLQRQKGVHVLVEAASLLQRSRPDVHFVVVGGVFPLDPGYEDELRELARRYGLADRVHFVGQQTDIPLWLQAMDVVTLPAIRPEGFGMAVIEAMALGKTVIATRSGGPEEIIEDGRDGYLVPPGDAHALADRIEQAISGNQTAEMGLLAQQKASCYSADRLAGEMAGTLGELFGCDEKPPRLRVDATRSAGGSGTGTTRRRVAIVMSVGTQLGGAEVSLMHLLRANGQGPEVDYCLAFLKDGAMATEARELGYDVEVFPSGRLRELGKYVGTVAALERWLSRVQPDAVLSWLGQAHLYAGVAARMAGVPAIWFQRAIPDRHWTHRASTRVPARAIFCSSHAIRRAQQRLKPRRDYRVIFPAVDTSKFDPNKLPSPQAARGQLGLPTDGCLVGVVARLQRQKGVHVFLEAAAILRQEVPDSRFAVVGGQFPIEPDYPEVLQELARTLRLDRSVHFVGQQTNTALWMQAMDVVVLPSVGPEGFGITVIEAMALGKPVVATRTGGPEEIITDGVDGYLADPGDATMLARLIQEALPHATDSRFAQSARATAARYTPERLARSVADALLETL